MEMIIPDSGRFNIINFIREVGYSMLPLSKNGSLNFQKRLTANTYPRLHIYVKKERGEHILNIHLDQKKSSYEGYSAHSGEYEGELVENEVKRIQEYLKKITS